MTDKKDLHAELMELADGYAIVKFVEGIDGNETLAEKARDALDDFARTLTDCISELEAKLEIDPAHSYDGIDCRDATIRELEAQLDAVGAGGVSLSMSMFASRKDYDEAKDAQPAPAVVGSVALVRTLLLEAEKFWWNDGPEGKTADDMNAANDAVLRALAAPQLHQIAEPASQWISVDERLPLESDGTVAVLMDDGSILTAWATYWHGSSNGFAQWTHPFDVDGEEVSHWMPLPPLPATPKDQS